MLKDESVEASSMPTYTILIVDDNSTNLGVLANYLEKQNFTVLVARDGKSGLEKARYAQPDMVLLDVMMPEMDGFETCALLKADERTRKIPVIFMTALTEAAHKVRGFEIGAVDYVTKPLHQEEVMARVMTHLRLRDLTEHLEREVAVRLAERDQAYHRLERLDRAKSDFIQVTSHELRTPLAIVDGYAQVLREETAVVENEELSRLVGSILSGTGRMLDTINVILDATRVDTDMMVTFKEEVSLALLVQEVHRELETALAARQLSFSADGLTALPPVLGDEELLHKLFYHVIVNAVKFTPDGGEIEVTGRVTAVDDKSWAEIRITDSGIGIDPADLELIFEKFYQTGRATLHSSGKTNFKGGGPGLGLAIARGVAQVHGGRIRAESEGHNEEKLRGSTFVIQLPL